MNHPFNRQFAAITAIVATSLALCIPAAHADLRVNIFDDPSSGSLKVLVFGKLDTLPSPLAPPSPDLFSCGVNGLLGDNVICTGAGDIENLNLYDVDGGVATIPLMNGLGVADSWSGSAFALLTSANPYPSNVTGILSTYTPGAPFFSSATFNGQSLSSIGLARGLVGTWNLTGTSEKITVIADPVPGPLPVIGAASAYAFSRRLRSRIRSKLAG